MEQADNEHVTITKLIEWENKFVHMFLILELVNQFVIFVEQIIAKYWYYHTLFEYSESA